MRLHKTQERWVLESDWAIAVVVRIRFALSGFETKPHLRGWSGLHYLILVQSSLPIKQRRKTIVHELQHTRDMDELGYFVFVKAYMEYNHLVGYWMNPFEIRAREFADMKFVPTVANDKRIKI